MPNSLALRRPRQFVPKLRDRDVASRFSLANIQRFIACDWNDEGLATGALATVPNSGPFRAANTSFHLRQPTATLQPSKSAQGIFFAGNSGRHMTYPYLDDSLKFNRWQCIRFIVHPTNGTQIEQCNLYQMNAFSGGSIAGDNTPRIYFNRAGLSAGVNCRIANPGTTDCWVEQTGLIADGVTENVLLAVRRCGRLFFRLNGGAEVMNATYSTMLWPNGNTGGFGYVGHHSGTSHPEFTIKQCIWGQMELSQALADKIFAEQMWKAKRPTAMHSSNPWRFRHPVAEREIDWPSSIPYWVDAECRKWAAETDAGKNSGTILPRFQFKGQAAPAETGYTTVWSDDFDTNNIVDSFSGNHNNGELWSPGWMSIIGDPTNASQPRPGSAPDLYVYNNGELALNIISNGTTARVSAFFTVDNSGKGRYWKDYIWKCVCRLPLANPLSSAVDALFPCPLWGYGIMHLFDRYGERYEWDVAEFEGIDPGFVNGGSTHFHRGQWPNEPPDGVFYQPYFEHSSTGAPLGEPFNRKLDAAFWGAAGAPTINIFDGLNHTWSGRVDLEGLMVYLYVDGYEICRHPILPQVHEQKFYIICDNVLFQTASRPPFPPAGTYPMYMSRMEVRQKDTLLAKVPAPFSAKPTLSGTLSAGNTLTLDTKLPAGTDFWVWYYRRNTAGTNSIPIRGRNGNTVIVPAGITGQQIWADVHAVGYTNQPNCWSTPVTIS